jgi:hypothetical protein
VAFVVVSFVALGALGCSGAADDEGSPTILVVAHSHQAESVPEVCEPGDTRGCEVCLPDDGELTPCVVGSEFCGADGAFGDCVGELVHYPVD